MSILAATGILVYMDTTSKETKIEPTGNFWETRVRANITELEVV